MTAEPANALTVDVGLDFVCPWCLIGKRHLEAALALLRARFPDVVVDIAWHPVPLIPNIPPEGLPFAAFYEHRLGSPEAVAARQAQVRAAAQAAGVVIHFDRMQVFPNVLNAHRLFAQAGREGGPATADALVEALFDAYFVQGRDIGNAQVLADVARACGVSPLAADAPLPVAPGPRSVPCFRFNDRVVVDGAQPPEMLLQAMRHALGR